jgi:hypothetical protein
MFPMTVIVPMTAKVPAAATAARKKTTGSGYQDHNTY